MALCRRAIGAVKAIAQRSDVDAELTAELDEYLEASASAKMAQGMSREDAYRAARTELGSVEAVKDRVRDVGWEAPIENLWRDVRSGFRLIRRSPGFAVVAVSTLALGIGANTAIFSVINALLLKPVPVPAADRLATISSDYALRHGFTAGVGWNYDMWQRLQERVGAFDGALAWTDARFNLASGGESDFVEGLFTDAAFFSTLGVRAVVGRTFEPADDLLPRAELRDAVAVISHRMWQRRFKGAADVAGQPLVVEGVPVTIVGVTPPDFFGLEVGKAFDVALPLGSEPMIRGPRSSFLRTTNFVLTVVLRLKADQTIESGTAVIRAMQPHILGVAPDELPRVSPPFLREPFTLIAAPTGTADRTGLRREYRQPLLIVFALVTLVAVVACLNIANLLLARASARKHEFAVRLALGSPAWRLGRQLLVESLVLAVLGSWLGFIVAGWIGKALVSQISLSGVPAFLDLSVDVRVLVFSMATGLLTAVIFGTAPAVVATRTPPIEALKDQSSRSTQAPAGSGRMTLPALFIVLQVALSLVLIVASALLVRTFGRLARVPLGFDRDRVLVVRVDTSRAVVAPQHQLAYFQRLVDVVRTAPGVAEAAASHTTPFDDGSRAPLVAQRDRMLNAVGPDWFATYGTPLHSGRDVSSSDVASSPPVAIINESYARNAFAGRSPLGETVEGRTVVGVVGNAVFGSRRRGMLPTMYMPLSQSASMRAPGNASVSISVRPVAGAPLGLAPAVSTALTAVDPRLSFTFRTVGADVDASIARERLLASLSSAFGILALFLAALGLYGISSYAAVRRRAEIGMRMALGASRSTIISLVVRRSVLLTMAGTAIGLVVAAWVTRYLEGLLFGLTPLDPLSFIVVAIVFALVAIAASAIPAWRAANVDPLTAIRGD